MRVSALIPTFNRRNHIFRAIDSVLSQTVAVDEVIVVDDGSSDGTADALRARYGAKIQLIRQQNTGVSGARLRALREARGEWVAFLDSDDEWLPDRQSKLLAAAAKLPPDVAWLFGDMRDVNDEGEGKSLFELQGLRITNCPETFENSFSVVYPNQVAWFPGSLIRRKVLLETGCFASGLRSHEDLLAGIQVACDYKFAAIPSIVTKFYRTSDLRGSSLTHNAPNSPDQYRALMLALPILIKKTGKREPWARSYASAARALCKLRLAPRQSIRSVVMDQFRYGGSLTSVVFVCAAVFGSPGLYLWEKSAFFFQAICEKTKAMSKSFRTQSASSMRDPAFKISDDER